MNEKDLAEKILSVIPRLMRIIRTEIRSHAESDLTLPQYRVLAHISGGTLHASQLAELQGITLPAMSNIIDGLVRRELITREALKEDRRHIALSLTRDGKQTYLRIRKQIVAKLAELVGDLNATEQATLKSAMAILEGIAK